MPARLSPRGRATQRARRCPLPRPGCPEKAGPSADRPAIGVRSGHLITRLRTPAPPGHHGVRDQVSRIVVRLRLGSPWRSPPWASWWLSARPSWPGARIMLSLVSTRGDVPRLPRKAVGPSVLAAAGTDEPGDPSRHAIRAAILHLVGGGVERRPADDLVGDQMGMH